MKSLKGHLRNRRIQQSITVHNDKPCIAGDNRIQESLQCIFSKRAEALASRCRNHVVEQNGLPILVFKAGAEQYGIKLSELSQITPVLSCTPIPKSAPYVVGIVNLGGNVISVIDISQLTGHDNQDAESSGYLLFLKSSNYPIAFRINVLMQVEYTTQDEFHATDHMPSYAHGVTKTGVCLLNIQKLFESNFDITYEERLL